MKLLRPLSSRAPVVVLFALVLAQAGYADSYPVINVADGSLRPNGGPVLTVQSNPVAFNVTPPTSSSMELLQYAGDAPNAETVQVSESQCGPAGGPFTIVSSAVTASGNTINIPGPVRVVPARALKRADPIIFRVTDPNANMDPLTIETVSVFLRVVATGQRAEIVIRETGPDSGVFTGMAAAGPCGLNVGLDEEIAIDYTDPTDPTDSVSASVIVDPFGRVFDSSTGQMIDGAVVTLIEADTGQPAEVFADDGVSSYPSTVVSGGTVVDGTGTVFNLGPGEYRFPFVRTGRYRLMVEPPAGYRHPSDVPTKRLQTLFSAPFEIVLGSRGEIFVVNPGPALEIDIPLDPVDRAPFVTKSANKTQLGVGDLVQYRVTVANPNAVDPLREVVLTDMLPAGFRVRADSVRVDGTPPAPDATVFRGREFTVTLAMLAPLGEATVTYVAEAAAGTPTGDALNQAWATSEAGRSSNRASVVVRVVDDLFRERTFIMGRVVVDSCDRDVATDGAGLPGVGVYLEDGTYVVTDANGRYHFEGVIPGTHVVQLDPSTIDAEYEVAQCARNTRSGDGYAQFARPRRTAPWRADFHVRSRAESASTIDAGRDGVVRGAGAFESYDEVWLARQGPAFEWVFPGDGYVPAIPSTHVLVKHAVGERVELRVNGTEVGPLNFDTVWKNALGTAGVSHWRGVDLRDGDNHVTATLLAPDGTVQRTLERTIHYSTAPVSAELVPERSVLVADGRTVARIAVRLRDKDGFPARPGIGGHYSLEPPHSPFRSVSEDARRQLNLIPDERPSFRVGQDGIAFLEVEPTNDAGEIVARVEFDQYESREIRAWLTTPVRDWILVGLAEGSVAHRSLSEHVEQLPPGGGEGLNTDGRVAFYARGRVRGEWLMTLAYDSSRSTGEERGTLHQQIEPDRYYTVYGDASEQRTNAPSSGKLYVRIERETFIAMVGDYDTGMTVTDLARYSRSLHGFKTAYRGDHLSWTAFGADTDSRFVRDEIRGDGTSGLYRLSGQRIVLNTEKVAIETRDRFHPERAVAVEQLVRHVDYDIDYVAGTLFFKRAIPSRDFDFNPVVIVVDYETDSRAGENVVAGGRLATHWFDNRVEAGASGIYEGVEGARADLRAVDVTIRPDARTTVRAEFARSSRERRAGTEKGTAWLAEAVRNDGHLDGRAYYRRQASDFGLGQQRGAGSGMEEYGLEADLALSDRWRLELDTFRQRQLDTSRRREVAEARADRRLASGNVFGGMRWARDSEGAAPARTSVTALAGGSRGLLDERLLLRFSSEVALAGEDENPDYPTRLLAGADYRLNDRVTLFAEHELTLGPSRDTHDTRIGSKSTPWRGAQLTSALGRSMTDSGNRIFSNSGFQQRWKINERWSLDASLDRSTTLTDDRYVPLNRNAPPASGMPAEDEDYTALSGGVNYRVDDLVAFSRSELRVGDRGDRAMVGLGFYRELVDGVAYSLNLDGYSSTLDSGDREVDGEISGGIAWRPSLSKWMALGRLDLVFERRDRQGTDSRTLKLVGNGHAHYQWRDDTYIAGRAGVKVAHDTFDDWRATAVTTLAGLDIRHDLSEHWDIGAHADVLRSWSAGTMDYSAGVSVGFSPVDSVWVDVGYNLTGFADRDFAGANYRERGPFAGLRIRVDERSARAAKRWILGE